MRRVVGDEPPSVRVPHPATVVVVPEAGSEPFGGSFAYPMEELVGMAVASFQMATSLLRVELEKLGWTLTEETRTRVPPEPRF